MFLGGTLHVLCVAWLLGHKYYIFLYLYASKERCSPFPNFPLWYRAMKMGHLSCSRSSSSSPSYSPFRPRAYILFLAGRGLYAFVNRSCDRSSSRFNCEAESKSGDPGGTAPWWGSGGESPWSWCFLGTKTVIKALTKYMYSFVKLDNRLILKLLMHKNNIFSYFTLVYWGGSPFPTPIGQCRPI